MAGGAKAGSKGGSSASPASTDLPTGLASCLPSGSRATSPPRSRRSSPPRSRVTCPPRSRATSRAACRADPERSPYRDPERPAHRCRATCPPTYRPRADGGLRRALDACAVITPALITGDSRRRHSGQALPQASSFGDPNAKDCYYFGGEATWSSRRPPGPTRHAGERLHLRGGARCGTGPGRDPRLGFAASRAEGSATRWRDPGQGPGRPQLLDHLAGPPFTRRICRSSRTSILASL